MATLLIRPKRCYKHSIAIDSRFTLQCNVVFNIYADLCSLLAATSQFSILIGQNMQLTGCHNGNEMRNTTPKFQLSGPTVHSLYCAIREHKQKYTG